MLKINMLKINISEGKPNRFEQADNITGVTRWLGALHELSGDVELSDVTYAEKEAEVAAVGDWVAKDWLRAYGVGEEAAKLRAAGVERLREAQEAVKMPIVGSRWLSSFSVMYEVLDATPRLVTVKRLKDSEVSAYNIVKFNQCFMSAEEYYQYQEAPDKTAGFFYTSGNTNYPKANTPDDKISGKHKEMLDELLGLSKIAHERFKDLPYSVDARGNPRIGSLWRQMYGKQLFKVVGITATNVECEAKGTNENVFFPFEQFRALIPASEASSLKPDGKIYASTDEPLLDKHTGDNWFWNVQMTAEKQRIDKIKAITQQKLNTVTDAPKIGSVWRSNSSGTRYAVYSICDGNVRLAYEVTPKQAFLCVTLTELKNLYVLEGEQKSSVSVEEDCPQMAVILDMARRRKAYRESRIEETVHPLQEVFDAVIAQVTTGKGQRHGGGEQPFFEQPWFTTTQQVGIGFPLGQAMKKLGESSSKPDAESFETELLGAIAYAAMAYLANKKLAGKS